MNGRGGWVLLALAAALVLGVGIDRRELDGTTAFYGALARQVAETGELAPLHHGPAVYVLKPPLVIWATAGLYELFGVAPWTSTFVSRLFGVLCVLLTARLAARRAGSRAGAWAAVTMLVAVPFLENAATLRLDTAMIAGILLAMVALTQARGAWRPVGFFGGVALATLAKGLPGLLPLGLALVVWWDERTVRRDWALASLLLVPVVAWFAFVQATTGSAVAQIATDLATGHDRGALSWAASAVEHVVLDPIVAAPHVALAAAFAVRSTWRRRRSTSRARRREDLVLLLWLVAVVVAATIKPSHRVRYLLPALPVLAVWIGGWLAIARPRWRPRAVVAALGVLGLVSFLVPASWWPANHHSGAARATMVERLAAEAPDAPVLLIEREARPRYGRQWAGRDWAYLHLGREVRPVDVEDLAGSAGQWAVLHESVARHVPPLLRDATVVRTPNARLLRVPDSISRPGTASTTP